MNCFRPLKLAKRNLRISWRHFQNFPVDNMSVPIIWAVCIAPYLPPEEYVPKVLEVYRGMIPLFTFREGNSLYSRLSTSAHYSTQRASGWNNKLRVMKILMFRTYLITRFKSENEIKVTALAAELPCSIGALKSL